MENIGNHQAVRQYLLGELTEEEQRPIEELLLTDHQFLEELSIAEDDLIDEYIMGLLTNLERERFETRFLSTPERHQKLRFARAFRKHIATASVTASLPSSAYAAPPPASWKQWLPASLRAQNPVFSLSLAALLLLLAVGVGLWAIRVQPTRGPQISSNGGQPPANFFPVTLTPGAVREAGEMKRVALPAGTGGVQLRLEVGKDEHQSYRATLQSDDGLEVFTGDKLKAETSGSGKVVILNLPAELLSRRDYQVKLSGINQSGDLEDIGSYSFRVVQN